MAGQGKNVVPTSVCTAMSEAEQRHLDWLARSLARHDYRPLRRGDIESIQRVGEAVSVAPGIHLYREGEPAAAVYLIEQGEVEIVRGTRPRRRVIARAGAGSVLGDLAMFGERSYLADVRAAGPVRARRFARSRLLPELAVNPAILLRWLVAVMSRVEQTQRRVISLMHKPVLDQVADLLVEESSRQPDVNLSQSTIAALLGVSRQSVNEALGRLRELGLVETGYRRIAVLDPDRLEEVSGPDT